MAMSDAAGRQYPAEALCVEGVEKRSRKLEFMYLLKSMDEMTEKEAQQKTVEAEEIKNAYRSHKATRPQKKSNQSTNE